VLLYFSLPVEVIRSLNLFQIQNNCVFEKYLKIGKEFLFLKLSMGHIVISSGIGPSIHFPSYRSSPASLPCSIPARGPPARIWPSPA
jgi:hypothetical protein